MLRKLVKEITERSPEKVLVQLPEGLKTKAAELEEMLTEEGINSVVSMNPCYGACDIKDHEARRLGCDLLVHVGHSKFCREEEVETLYFPWYYDVDPLPILENSMGKLGGCEKVGLVFSINFREAFQKTRDYLRSKGKEVFTSRGNRAEEGQILGCDVAAGLDIEEKVDCFLYIGSGRFHPLGLYLKTDRPVYVMDFEEGEILEPDFDQFERQRHAVMGKAQDAEVFAVLISTKKGQCRPKLAGKIKKRLEDLGKEVSVFSMDEIRPDKLEGIKVDCWVNTACPRVTVEHRTDFGVPILNPGELDEIIGDEK